MATKFAGEVHSNFTPTKEKNWKEYSVDGARLLTRH